MKRIRIFISSVQSEFAAERAMLADYIRTDVLLGKFFDPFIFEEVPAYNHSPQHVYLTEVERCDIYLGLIGNLYGYKDEEGVSPTEHEFDLATQLFKTRLIFIKSIGEEARVEKEKAFIRKVEQHIVRKTFVDLESLRTSVYASLIRYLEEKELIRWQPYGLTIPKLHVPHKSLPTNPLLADPMYWNGYIEKVGTGTEDILKKCKELGLKELVFQQEEDFKVVIWGDEEATDQKADEEAKYPEITALISANPSITREELAKELNLSDSAVKRRLENMKKSGWIKRVGPDRSGYWKIINKRRNNNLFKFSFTINTIFCLQTTNHASTTQTL